MALINALDMQLESGDPEPAVVRLLGIAVVALAEAKGLDIKKLKLLERLDALNHRVAVFRTG